jgi:hypothetical protein
MNSPGQSSWQLAAYQHQPQELLRNQESLTGTIDFEEAAPLTPAELYSAYGIFAVALETHKQTLRSPIPDRRAMPAFHRDVLLQETCAHVQDKSKFFKYLFLFIEKMAWNVPENQLDFKRAVQRHRELRINDPAQQRKVGEALNAFAFLLVEGFFIPSKYLCFYTHLD